MLNFTMFASVKLWLILSGIWLQVDRNLSAQAELPLKLPCSPKRTEIVFPVISDVLGRVTSPGRSAGPYLVTFNWRRKKLDLYLYQNHLNAATTHSEWREDNQTIAEWTVRPCHYHGYVKGHKTSYLAVSTCDGLAGYVQTDQELLFIRAAISFPSSSQGRRPHVLYTCETKQRVEEPDWQTQAARPPGHLTRSRRSTDSKTKFLEVMVVVDSSLVEEVGSRAKTQDYVMTLMNIANTVYQHHTLGVDIRVVVVKIVFLDKSQQKEVFKKLDAFRTVNLFCEWSQTQVPRGQPMDYDISVLITKEELGPSGYAPITGLCNPSRSCAAVRDEGFTTGFIIAHEMAHVFGLFHDGHGNDCHGGKYVTSMMAALVESKLNHFWWSDCSSKRMKEMVRYLFCLNNEPRPVSGHYSLKAPVKIESKLGFPWTLDFQCRMEFGSHFKLCAAFYNDPCGTLWCSHTSQPHLCRTKRGPPLPGSSCGQERECRNDHCQYVGRMKPVDGKWAPWGTWTECSADCGVGIRQRARMCDNPAPAYNGKSCEGEANEWDTCVNNTCSSYDDIRAGECAVWDSLQIRYGTHKWQPFQSLNASSQCRQTCRSHYTNEVVTIDVDVADGAPCGYSSNNSNVCVGGACLTVGCDGRINSTLLEDMCGVCAGNGSQCKTVKGDFIKKPGSGETYILVATIPTGARSIHIEETKPSGQFLAIQNQKFGIFNLNGDKRQSADVKLVINGAMFDYKRSSAVNNEIITSPGPLKGQIQVMVYPNKVLDNISIHFSYVVHKSDVTLEMNKYKWKFEKWSNCSVQCGQGVQTIIHGCYDKDSDAKVNDEACSLLKPPRKDEVRCYRDPCGPIRYNYAMSNDYEDCDAKCGETGLQVQKFYCEKFFQNNGTYEPAAAHLCQHLTKPHQTRVCQGQPCQVTERFQWYAFETWSECPCGGPGLETRDVYCEKVTTTTGQDKEELEKVDTAMCQDVPDEPESIRSCKGKPCGPRFQWTESGLYTTCDAPCGGQGTQEAILECEQVTVTGGVEFYEIADNYFCDEVAVPTMEHRQCQAEPCQDEPEKYQWQATEEWSDCTAKCGQRAMQARLYKCVKSGQEDRMAEISQDKCGSEVRGNETRDCEGPKCPLKWRVDKWSECSVTCGRGKHYRKVYCGDPDTDMDDYRCTDPPPVASKFCNKKDCLAAAAIKLAAAASKEPRDEECLDKFLNCKTFKAVAHRCKKETFRKKCCKTCLNLERSARKSQNLQDNTDNVALR